MATNDFTKEIFKIERNVTQSTTMVMDSNRTVKEFVRLLTNLQSHKQMHEEKIARLEEDMLIAKKNQTFDARIKVLENFANFEANEKFPARKEVDKMIMQVKDKMA